MNTVLIKQKSDFFRDVFSMRLTFAKLTGFKKMLSVLLVIISFSGAADASKGINFQGVIKRPDGSTPTISGTSVNLKVLSPNGCILREEFFSGVNIADGYLNLVVGQGTPIGADPSLSFQAVFENTTPRSSLVCVNPDASVNLGLTNYAPAGNDARKLRVDMTISGDRILADFNLRSLPFAVNSETLNGKSESDFANINGAQGVTQGNLESIFNRFTKLDAILNGYNSGGTSAGINITGNAATATSATNVTGTVAVANGGTGATNVSDARTNLGLGPLAVMSPGGTANATTYLRGDGSWATISAGGSGTVTEVTSANADIGVATTTTTPVLTLNVGTGPNQILKLNGTSQIPAVSGANLTDLNATQLTSGALPAGRLPAFSGDVSSSSGSTTLTLATVPVTKGGTGLTAAGTSNQLLGVNNAANAMEYKTVTAGAGISVTHGANDITIAASGGAVNLASGVTGTLPIANGGTGATSANDALNALLPAQTTHSGKFLTTNGTTTSWGTFSALGTALANGTMWIGNGSGQAAAVTMSNDATISNSGALTIASGAVNSSKIADGSVGVADLNIAGSMPTNTGLLVRDGTQFNNKTCSGNQVLIWTVANGWSCSNVVLTESDPKVGTITTNSISKWDGSALVTSAITDNAGNVGIGTTSPGAKLDVNGTLNATAITVGGVPLSSGGNINSPVTVAGVIGASCSTIGQMAKDSGDNLLVCDDNASPISEGAICGSVGAMTFDENGVLYVCFN